MDGWGLPRALARGGRLAAGRGKRAAGPRELRPAKAPGAEGGVGATGAGDGQTGSEDGDLASMHIQS
jgi:hypothetical protein